MAYSRDRWLHSTNCGPTSWRGLPLRRRSSRSSNRSVCRGHFPRADSFNAAVTSRPTRPLSPPAACEAMSSIPKARSTSCSSRRKTGGSPTRTVSRPESRRSTSSTPSRRPSCCSSTLPPINGSSTGSRAAQRVGLQRHAAAKDQRIVNSLSTSAEERYEEFLRMYPSIALRVPQWMLASYLGVSPETLSRVRKNRSRK
jgi:hypothetical protein